MGKVYKRLCDSCERYYEGYGSKYCSASCLNTFQLKLYGRKKSAKVEADCLNCKIDIVTTASRIAQGRGRFCSIACNATYTHRGLPKPKSKENILSWNEKRSTGEVHVVPWNKGEPLNKTCEICESTFEVQQNRSESARFCSIDCSNKWKRTVIGGSHPLYSLVERACEWCDKSFRTKPAKIRLGEGRFCSRNCVGAYTTSLQGGRRSSIEIAVEVVLKELDIKFVSQQKLGSWIVDFFLPEKNLVIECDGDYWHKLSHVQERDARKNFYILSKGYKLVRLSEKEINKNANEAIRMAYTNL